MAQSNISITAMKLGLIDENTIRVIRIGYPLLRVQTNIISKTDNQEFCLIKKYIHRLVTGDQPDSQNPIPYVKNRLQAFQLLGLDGELFDVSSYFYDDLIFEGKIHDSPYGALAGAAPKNDPQLARVRTSRQISINLTIDPFSLDIYGDEVSTLRGKSKEELAEIYKDDICLPELPVYVSKPEELEALINQQNFSFENCSEEFMTHKLQSQNMPHGTTGIEFVSESSQPVVEDIWVPCFLVYKRTEEGNRFFLYNQTDGKPIDIFPINDPSHKDLIDFSLQLFRKQYYGGVDFSLTKTARVSLSNSKSVIVDMDKNGNYHTPISDEVILDICMSDDREVADTLQLITEGVGVIPTREAGRLVYFNLTETQFTLCKGILKSPHDRYKILFPWLHKLAEEGNTEALVHTATCYFMGHGTSQNLRKAFELYSKAAEKEHHWALLHKGTCQVYGYGVEVDYDAAIESFKKIPSVSRQYFLALHNIGVAYMRKKDYKNAEKFLILATEEPFTASPSCHALGHLYNTGLGVEANAELAVKFYSEAASKGHIAAQHDLALCYIQGKGVTKDIDKAKELLTQAIRPCTDEQLFFMGSKPWVNHNHLIYTESLLNTRKKAINSIRENAKKILEKL